MNLFLDLFAVLALFIFLGKYFRNMEGALIFAFLIKPLIDTGWDFKIIGLSLIDFYSIFFLVISYSFVFKKRLFAPRNKSYIGLWAFAHLGLIFLFLTSPFSAFEGVMRALFFPLGLVLLPYFLGTNNHNNQSKILKYLLIGSVFAAAISILQGVGIINEVTARQTKGLERANGFYHDIVTVRIYIVQGLLALYFAYRTKILKLSKLTLAALLFIFLAGGFFTYSKAFIGIIAMGVLMFLFTEKNKIKGLLFILLTGFCLLMFKEGLVEDISQVFVKEINYSEGNLEDEGQLFSGRGMLWKNYWDNFNETDSFTQFLGFNKNDGRTHNEFLRILILSGLLGLIAYLLLYINLIGSAIKSLFQKRPLIFLTGWCLGMLILDGISVVWGLYPYYMILILGFFFISVQYKEID